MSDRQHGGARKTMFYRHLTMGAVDPLAGAVARHADPERCAGRPRGSAFRGVGTNLNGVNCAVLPAAA